MTEQTKPHTANTASAAPDVEAQIAHIEDLARFGLDTAAMFGTDIEVADALKAFHTTNARVSTHKAHQHEAGSEDRITAETSAQAERELAGTFVVEGDELSAGQKERVSQVRDNTKSEVVAVAIEGDTSFYLERYGQERGAKHIAFYKELATEAVQRATGGAAKSTS